MHKNIEVEIRALITSEKYEELKRRLDAECEFLGEEHQVSYYFDAPVDLRAQESDTYSKIWMKGGAMHDGSRKELELRFAKKDIVVAKELFASLGFPVNIVWDRKRRTYRVDDITLCLDETKGYGCIIESELMAGEGDEEDARERLLSLFKKYDLEETPKAVFNVKFADYKLNWKRYLTEAGVII
jgi:predicted adenylyl cyclase CyaB